MSTFVQKARSVQPFASLATTLVLPFGGAVQPGSLLLAFITGGTGAPGAPAPTVTDPINGIWTDASGNNDLPVRSDIFFIPKAAAGTPTVTVTYAGSYNYRSIILAEYSGTRPSLPEDTQHTLSNAIGSTAPSSGAPALPAANGSLFFSGVWWGDGAGVATAGINLPFVKREQSAGEGGNYSVAIESAVQASAAPIAADWTVSSSAVWACCLAIFFDAAAGGGAGGGNRIDGARFGGRFTQGSRL